MSSYVLTNSERAYAVARLGYTDREAGFVSVAALQAGYFLRRQYCRYIQKEVGGTAAALIEKLVSKGHARAIEGCRNIQVFHLGSRPLYAALGEEDNRNRRTRPPVVIKNKLMCLDLVLDFPDRVYLATEHEKVAHFTHVVSIPEKALPTKEFRSPTATTSTSRYFVDKYPIALRPDRTVSFCFVDEGVATTAGFETYLNQYASLWAHLPHFELIYAAASSAQFVHARKTFEQFCSRASSGDGHVDVERLLTYFEDRHSYDSGSLQSFDRARLIRMRDDRQAFSGRAIELLYDVWKTKGEAAIRVAMAHQKGTAQAQNGEMRTHLLSHNYDVFDYTGRVYGQK